MKNQYLFIIFLLFIVNNIQGQQIDISGLYSSSTAKQLKNNWGYGLRYNHFIKNNKIGLSFKHYFYNTEYDDIRSSTEDGISKYIEEYKPQNSRITVNLIYSYILVDNEKSNLYLGYNVGLNYYHFKGEKTRIENGFVKGGQYTYDYTVYNKIGFGLMIEYEINEVFSERISTSILINPEITTFEKLGMVGGYNPWVIGWLNFTIGLKYSLFD